MMGVFVQLNEGNTNPMALAHPVGYVIEESGCWEWVGYRSEGGYGIWYFDGKARRAHRVMYERTKGSIPTGLQLDHLCRNRACVNPDHLEVVTQRENIRRGEGLATQNSVKTKCPKGHPYSPANTYNPPNRNGRECRTCKQRARRARTLNQQRPKQCTD